MTRWPAPVPLEKAVQAQITHALRALGFHVSSTSQTRPSRQAIGIPDLWVMHPTWGLACWVEVKRPGGRLSLAQRAWHSVAARAGVPVLVAYSVADVLEGLAALGAPLGGRDGGT